MTQHDDAAELARILDALDQPHPDTEVQADLDALAARRLAVTDRTAVDPPPDEAAVLVAAVRAEGGEPAAGHLVERTVVRVVEDVDGIPTGLVETRRLAITSCVTPRP